MQSVPANEIIPGLWLGNAVAAADGKFLVDKKIRAVFNCTKNLPFHEAARIRYRIPVDDNLQQEEIRNMELWAFESVYKVRLEHKMGPVFVHCHAGMQRSAAVVAMYLIATQNLQTEQAIRYIRERRPIAFTPAPNFLKSITGFEKTLDGMKMSV